MKILFIQTGGTIDKDYPQTTKGWAFEIHKPAVGRILKKLNPSFSYEVKSIIKKDSLEINYEDRELILKSCNNSDIDKIIITHGTDTMPETANHLSQINDKTIIITGAMLPERFTNSDAEINIGMAIAAVQTLNPGVYIAMHGLIIPHDKIDRDLETGQYLIKSQR